MRQLRNYTVLFILLTCFQLSWSQINDFKEIKELSIKTTKTNLLFQNLYDAQSENYNWDRSIFILHVEELGDQICVRLAIVYKDGFAEYLNEIQREIYGYFIFDKWDVLVFGEIADKLFTKTSEERNFEYLDMTKVFKKITVNEAINDPPYLPSVYEPEVWVYILNSEAEYIFKEKGLLNLLE